MKQLIKLLLDRMGLLDQATRAYHSLRTRITRMRLRAVSPEKRRRQFYETFDGFLAELDAIAPMYRQKTLLVHGYFLQNKRKDLLIGGSRRLADADPNRRVLFLNTAVSSNAVYSRFRERFLPVDSITLPRPINSPWSTLANTPGIAPDAGMQALMAEKEYLRIAIESAASAMPSLRPEYVQTLMCEAYRCYDAVLTKLNIAGVSLWCEFKYNHYLLSEMCRERGIPVSYAEYGSLPGTIVLDSEGQMGESAPARRPEELNAMPVSGEELAQAEKIVDYLKSSGINRKNQPQSTDNSGLLAKLRPGRPIVMFAGQLDQDSGLVPYTEASRTYHSPVYRSTLEANLALAEIAGRHDWNYIFKPHPSALEEVNVSRLPKNVIYIDNININDIIDIADVVVTILSSTVYVSLVRDTASVMLGYNQIHGKGCAYEALTPDRVEPVLCEAVEKGYTPEMRAAFIRHVAQMQKYYLFNDCVTKAPIRYGRGFGDVVGFFGELCARGGRSEPCDQRAVILCDSLTSVFSAVHLRACLPQEEHVSLILLSGKRLSAHCSDKALQKCFDEVRAVDGGDFFNFQLPAVLTAEDDEPEESEYARWRRMMLARVGMALPLEGITDVYLATHAAPAQAAALSALERDPAVRLHVLCLRRWPFSSHRDLLYYMMREYRLNFEDVDKLTAAVREIIGLDILGFRRRSDRFTVLTPLASKQAPGEMRPEEIFRLDSSPFFEPLRAAGGLDVTVSQQLDLLDIVESSLAEDPFADQA